MWKWTHGWPRRRILAHIQHDHTTYGKKSHVESINSTHVEPIQHDHTTYGEECKFGGGKSLREGMGQMTSVSAELALSSMPSLENETNSSSLSLSIVSPCFVVLLKPSEIVTRRRRMRAAWHGKTGGIGGSGTAVWVVKEKIDCAHL